MVKENVLYSDCCNYQNYRNVVLSNALLKTTIDKQVTILQRYLERGHTNMEEDSIPSLVERKFQNVLIYVPQIYVNIMRLARPKQPFIVHYVSYTFFNSMTQLTYYSSI